MKNYDENYCDDELLSAYLDGELDEAERAEVETRLQQDPQARELLSQLQTVSESVGSLPKHQLGAELREAVLSQYVVERREQLPEEGSYRRWIYAAGAIAAALLLMIYQPPQQGGDQQVAGMVRRPSARPGDEQWKARNTEPQPMVGAFGGLWTAQKKVPLNEVLERSLRIGVAQPATDEVLGQQLGNAAVEDFHVHLHSSGDKASLSDFKKILSASGVVFLDGLSDSDTESGAAKLEMVLLEAPFFVVQEIALFCSVNNGVWKSAEILRPSKSAPSIHFLKFPNNDRERANAAERLSIALAVRDKQHTPRGWAKHLNVDRLQLDLVDGLGQSGRAEGTIRVLFFLHPAAN